MAIPLPKRAQAIDACFEKIVIIAPVITKINPIIPKAIYTLFSTIFYTSTIPITPSIATINPITPSKPKYLSSSLRYLK